MYSYAIHTYTGYITINSNTQCDAVKTQFVHITVSVVRLNG